MKDKPSTLELALEMSRFAWDRRDRKGNPWTNKTVAAFVLKMDCAGYVFDKTNYPIDGCAICSKWEQVWAWACAIADNERDTLAGR